MNRTTLLNFGGALAAVLSCVAVLQSQTPNQTANLPNQPGLKTAVQSDPARTAVGEYLLGTKVNDEPAIMHREAAAKCASARDAQNGPHARFYLSVYVNDIGRKVIADVKPKFPVGTLLVKEKLRLPTSRTPELRTAMYKHEPGYDPDHGDWEYFVITGEDLQVTARGKLENCRDCHLAKKDTDYVFLDYLTPKDRERLQSHR